MQRVSLYIMFTIATTFRFSESFNRQMNLYITFLDRDRLVVNIIINKTNNSPGPF